jgi:hypothetical protein
LQVKNVSESLDLDLPVMIHPGLTAETFLLVTASETGELQRGRIYQFNLITKSLELLEKNATM